MDGDEEQIRCGFRNYADEFLGAFLTGAEGNRGETQRHEQSELGMHRSASVYRGMNAGRNANGARDRAPPRQYKRGSRYSTSLLRFFRFRLRASASLVRFFSPGLR